MNVLDEYLGVYDEMVRSGEAEREATRQVISMIAKGNERSTEWEAVRQLGDAIGYGRVMQLAEQIWNEKTPGSALTTGPCTSFLVPCPHLSDEHEGWLDKNGHCDWCCGADRVTKKVADAMLAERPHPTASTTI